MPIAESTISVLLGFISGATCGIMGMMFYMRNKEKKNAKDV